MITIGQVLNDTYEITERLGSGGGGVIYKAYHRRMQKHVAIKLIKDDIKGNLNIRSEVDMLKNLKNDFLPQVLDFVEDGNDVYTVMEFIEGHNFKQLVYSGKKFDEKSVRKYAVQLCRAVKYLHNQNPPIIHSDIKPANIMLTPKDNICLIDFNISMMLNNGTATAVGGSQGFAAPEQFKRIISTPEYTDDFHEETRFIDNDETEILLDSEVAPKHTSKIKTKDMARAFIDTRTDIYGIGATIYYMLTSRTPISGYVDFRGIRCSAAIKDIILKAMNPNPYKRFQSASEMSRALLNNSYKKSKAPVYIALSALAAGLCCAAIFGASQLKNNIDGTIFEKDGIDSTAATNNLDIMNYNAQFIYKSALDYCVTCTSYGNSIPNGIYCSVLEKKKIDFNFDGTFDDMRNYLNSEIGQDTPQYYSVTVKNGLPDVAFWGTEPLDDIVGSITQDKIIEDNLIIGIYPPYNQTDEYLKIIDNISESNLYDESLDAFQKSFDIQVFEDELLKSINNERASINVHSINKSEKLSEISQSLLTDIYNKTYVKGTSKSYFNEKFEYMAVYFEETFDINGYKNEEEAARGLLDYEKENFSSKWLDEKFQYFMVSTSVNTDGTYCLVFCFAGNRKITETTTQTTVATAQTATVTQKTAPAESISAVVPKLNKTSVTITKGYQTTLSVSNASSVIWSTGDKSIVTVSSKGKVIGKNPGTTYIYAKIGSTTLKCKVTVVASKITANKSSVNLDNIGATATVTFTVKGSHSGITVDSTDSNVATAVFSPTRWDGNKITVKITANGAGNARIKVYNENYQSTCYKYVDVSVKDTTA